MATQYYGLPTYDGEDKNKPISYQVGWTNAMKAIDTALHNNALAAEPVEGLEEDVTNIETMVQSLSNSIKTLNDFMNRWDSIGTQLFTTNDYNVAGTDSVDNLVIRSNGIVLYITFSLHNVGQVPANNDLIIVTPKSGTAPLNNFTSQFIQPVTGYAPNGYSSQVYVTSNGTNGVSVKALGNFDSSPIYHYDIIALAALFEAPESVG